MSIIESEKIVTLLGYSLKPLFLVLEYIDGMNLYDMILENKLLCDFEERIGLLMDIAEGIFVLHNNNPPVAHLDLKSPNIMVYTRGNELHCKIIDFGYASVATRPFSERKIVNPIWLAPGMNSFVKTE